MTAKSEKGPPYTDGRDARYGHRCFPTCMTAIAVEIHIYNLRMDIAVEIYIRTFLWPLWAKLDLVAQLKRSWHSLLILGIESPYMDISLNWSWFSGCLPLILRVESIPYHQGDGGTDMYEAAKSGPTYKVCLLKYPIPCLCGHVGSWTQLGTYRASSLNQILRPFWIRIKPKPWQH